MAEEEEKEDFHKSTTLPQYSPESTPLLEEIPKVIGPYKIESLLEKGGMSILYLGTHPETKEPTTIKVLSTKYLSHPDIVQRFLNEAEIISLADHPNIVKLYGNGRWEGGLYIAMEFIQGSSLRHYLLQNPLSLKHALEIIIDIAYALCHLHTHGVIHRDLKPENILVTENGVIKVIDFGIAQLLTENDANDPQAKPRLIGTPIYMSPEQRENPETVSFPSDIYSLGIIAYELISGKRSHGQIHLSLMPKGIQKILNKALQPNPKDRYQDIVDFIADISAYLNSNHLEKDKKINDRLSELSENLKLAQIILMPEHAPSWDPIEIGIVTYKNITASGVYYDFFCISEELYGIFFGEVSIQDAEGLIYTSILRGMTHASTLSQKTPNDFLKNLNTLLLRDKIPKTFSFGYLLLNSTENNLIFSSSGNCQLWQMAKGNPEPTKLSMINPLLGDETPTDFIEMRLPWEKGDLLSINNIQYSKELPEDQFSKIFIESAEFSPQKQVEHILRKTKMTTKLFLDHTTFLISILRK